MEVERKGKITREDIILMVERKENCTILRDKTTLSSKGLVFEFVEA